MENMKIILGIILLVVIVMGTLSISSANASSLDITIKPKSITVYSDRSTYFTGVVGGGSLSNSPIVIKELENGRWKNVAQGYTDSNGKYKITVPANFWNDDKTVTVAAFSEKYQSQSFPVVINISTYGTTTKSQVSSNLSSNAKTSVYTNLSLLIREGTVDNSIQLKPILKLTNGNTLSSNYVDIYTADKKNRTISANQWSENIILGEGYFVFTAKFTGVLDSSISYMTSSAKANYDHTGSNYNSNPKYDQPKSSSSTTSSTKSSITNNYTPKSSSSTASSTTNIDYQYKDPSYKIKSKYYDSLNKLESGLELSESTLSGLVFEDSEANKKKEVAWDMRWTVVSSTNDGKDILRQAESYLKNQQYQKAWEKLHEFDRKISTANSHIYDIAQEIQSAKDSEYNYQEKNKSCILFWCEVKEQNNDLDLKIKDLELSVEQIKNIQKDITSAYQSEVQTQKLVKQQNESIQIQQRLEEENRQTEIRAMQEQQRLEEEKQRELNNQRILAEQEQKRLEEEQRQTEIRAMQEKQRLEEKNRIDAERNQIILRAKSMPLVKGWMNGELTYYVNELPSYTSQGVRDNVENLASWMDGKYFNGVKMKRSYSGGDISINWVKDYQEKAIGRMIGSHLIVGLGMTGCDNQWKPFDAVTVYRIMYHEVGHAMGQAHNKDYNNIMYESGTGNKFEYNYSDTISVDDGSIIAIPFCSSGEVGFSTEKTYPSSASYKVFVAPPNSNFRDVVNLESPFYLNCSDYEKSWNSYSNNCKVERGSFLLLYNPSNFGTGNDATIKIKLFDRNSAKDMDYTFKSDSRFGGLSDDYLYRVSELFR